MPVCAARRDTDPDAVTCTSALGGGKAICQCRVEVKALVKETETRMAPNARAIEQHPGFEMPDYGYEVVVPDSAREEGAA